MTFVLSIALLTAPSVHILQNGATVIVHQMPESKAYAAQIMIRAGSSYQDTESDGAHHLLEHLVFHSGTGRAARDAELAGSWLNATTFRELMRFVANGPAESWRSGVQSLIELVVDAAAPADRIGIERSIVSEEIAAQDLDPDAALDRALWKAAFPDSSWGPRTSGDPQRLATIQKVALDKAIAKHFVGENVVLVITGPIAVDDAVEQAERLSKLPRGERAESTPFSQPQFGRVAMDSPDRSARVGFGFIAPGIGDEDYAAYRIAIEALCGKYGILADAGLRTRTFFGPSEQGSLATLSVSGPDDAAEMEGAVIAALRSAPTKLTQTAFSNAKAAVLTNATARARTPAIYGMHLGIGVLFGKPDFAVGEKQAIEKVSREDVVKVFESWTPEQAVVVVWRKR